MLSTGATGDTLTVSNNLAAMQGPLPQVILLSNNPDPSTLWHEFWHAGLGLTDAGAVQTFNIQQGAGQSASAAFDNWLQGDCGASH